MFQLPDSSALSQELFSIMSSQLKANIYWASPKTPPWGLKDTFYYFVFTDGDMSLRVFNLPWNTSSWYKYDLYPLAQK